MAISNKMRQYRIAVWRRRALTLLTGSFIWLTICLYVAWLTGGFR